MKNKKINLSKASGGFVSYIEKMAKKHAVNKALTKLEKAAPEPASQFVRGNRAKISDFIVKKI